MTDKVAIVTGGTGALGRYIVNKLAAEEIIVYVPCRSIEEFNKVFDNSQEKDSEYFNLRKIYCKTCDATDENSVSDFVENVAGLEKGRIDFLINTVGGISPPFKINELSTDVFDSMLNINLKSVFYFTREVVKKMLINRFGRIVSIGAKAGTETSPERFAYSVSKAGVINLMDTVSEEMKDFNIRCNTVIPGIIDTPANREWGSVEDVKKWVKPEEISKVIYSLITDEYSSLRSSKLKLYGSF